MAKGEDALFLKDGRAASNRRQHNLPPLVLGLAIHSVETSNKQNEGDTPMPAEGKVCLPE